jgi:CHASE2 domain-containing sensor protein
VKRSKKKSRPAAESKPVGAPPTSASSEGHGRGREIGYDLLKGLLVIAVVLALKVAVEQTALGKQLELACYNLLQLRLSAEHVPVTVIDTSDLKPEKYNIDGQVGTATPREQLRKMLAAITEQKPKAIGVDIDFSPDKNGYIRPDDPDFFQFCLDMHEQRGVPIFLGIHRTMARPPGEWLRVPEYQELAANILIPKDRRRMLYEIKIESEETHEGSTKVSKPGKAMSVALADAYRRGMDDAPGWLRRVHENVLEGLHGLGFIEQVSEKRLGEGLTVADFLVDFSPIDSIETVRTINPVVLRDRSQHERIEGKMVLLGVASLDAAKDRFEVPGHEGQYPGVLLHACAANTLIQSPLFEVTRRGRLYIDVLFSLAILLPVILIRLYYRNRASDKVARHRLQGLLTIMVVFAAIVVGVICVRLTRVMWDDFLLALTAIVFHPSIERRLERSWVLLRGNAAAAFQRLVFTQEKEKHR